MSVQYGFGKTAEMGFDSAIDKVAYSGEVDH